MLHHEEIKSVKIGDFELVKLLEYVIIKLQPEDHVLASADC